MSMFGTSQGSFQNPVEHKPIVSVKATGSAPGKSEMSTPVKTQTIKPSSNKLK